MREIKYQCGCELSDKGIHICTLHLVMFEDLLPRDNFIHNGWHNLSQDIYNKITHCLNVEEQERAK